MFSCENTLSLFQIKLFSHSRPILDIFYAYLSITLRYPPITLPCCHPSLHERSVLTAQILLCSGVIADVQAKKNRMASALLLPQMC